MYIGENTALKWEHNGAQYALRIRQDDMPMNPREDFDNLCTMACWHRRYSLGDRGDTAGQRLEDFWRAEVRSRVNVEEIIDAAESGKLDGIRVEKRDGLVDVYETIMLRTVLGNSEPEEVLEYEGIMEGALPDYLIDDLTVGHCMQLLEPYLEVLPLWLYDHSGLAISCGSRVYPFNDRWDSGQIGWIFVPKDKIMSEVGTEYVLDEKGERVKVACKHDGMPTTWTYQTRPLTDDTWRKRADEIMESEVKLYDQYLRGEVFGFELYKLVDGEWQDEDSCYGFYGDILEENGMLDHLAYYGLHEAIANGAVSEGEAKEVHHVDLEFDF